MLNWIKNLFKKKQDYTWVGYEVSWSYRPAKLETHRDIRGRFTKGNTYGRLKKGMKYGKNKSIF